MLIKRALTLVAGAALALTLAACGSVPPPRPAAPRPRGGVARRHASSKP